MHPASLSLSVAYDAIAHVKGPNVTRILICAHDQRELPKFVRINGRSEGVHPAIQQA